jgi:predicted permease
MSAFAMLLLCLGIGVLAARYGRVPQAAPPALNWWILNAALPALVLAEVPKLQFSSDLLLPVLAMWIVFLGAVVLFPLLGRVFGWDRGTVGALTLTCGLGNTAFLGYAMVEALRGPEALGPAIIADQIGCFMALSTGGVMVAAIYAGKQPKAHEIIHKVLFFPSFLAFVVALLVRQLGGWPEAVLVILERLGSTLTPLALFSVGLQFRLSGDGDTVPLLSGLVWKLALAPLAVAVVGVLLGVHGFTLQASVLQAGMAPMISAGILAAQSGLAPALANRVVSLGILASLGTVPLINLLL